MFISYKSLEKEQARDLDYKIETFDAAITEAFKKCRHRVAIAFSGGKDSTVLWHRILSKFPEEANKLVVIYGNTGVEYPECVKFARQMASEWGRGNFYEATPSCTEAEGLKYRAQQEVMQHLIAEGRIQEVLKPDGKLKSTASLENACPGCMRDQFEHERLIYPAGTRKNYWWCVDQYGWPLLGKAASRLKAHRINIDCFLRFSNSQSKDPKLLKYYKLLRQVKFSQACCDILKKEPSERLQVKLDIDVIFKGLMAAESRPRKTNFVTRGYLFKSHRDHLGSDPFWHCNPLSIWTDDDIWAYIKRFNVPYSCNNVLDDNILACSDDHIKKVFAMLKTQKYGRALFTGGMEAARLKDWHVDLLRDLRPKEVFFAYDTADDFEPLVAVGKKLLRAGFTVSSHTLRAYVLIGYPGDTFTKAEKRLSDTIKAGFLPMAMLYRDKKGQRDTEWARFQQFWARPATVNLRMKAIAL